MPVEKAPLGRARLALNQGKVEIAAQNGAAGAGQAIIEARRHRADAGDRNDAKRDAGDEYAKTAQAAAQLAPGKAQRDVQAQVADGFGRGRKHHAASCMTRLSTKCVGAKMNIGRPSSNPMSQT